MPQPPNVGLLTRYVLENPYPLGAGLLVIALVVGWLGLRDGRSDRMIIAVASVLLAAGVIAAGLLVVTSGEHGRRVTRDLVEAAVTEDLVAADNLIADGARLQLGATTNISHDRDAIIDGLSRLADRYSVEDNRITMLDGYSASRDGAVVHLACWTEATGYGFYTPSQWVLRVERQDDGTWKVARITCISINAEPPPPLP